MYEHIQVAQYPQLRTNQLSPTLNQKYAEFTHNRYVEPFLAIFLTRKKLFNTLECTDNRYAEFTENIYVEHF